MKMVREASICYGVDFHHLRFFSYYGWDEPEGEE